MHDDDRDLSQPPSATTVTRTLSPRDVALYAVSVGADPVLHGDPDLRLVYERHPRFAPLPALAIVAAHDAISLLGAAAMRERVPGYAQERALHGEHYVRLSRPLRAGGVYETPAARPVRVTPKSGGDAAVVVLETETRRRKRRPGGRQAGGRQAAGGADADAQAAGEVVAVNQFTSFVLGAALGPAAREWTAPGAERRPAAAVAANAPPAPARPPDVSARLRVPTSAAALYRLNGDLNPLHVDPAAVPAGRFDGRPILHGLATLGASLLLLARAAGRDPLAAREVKCRFSSHVFPGDVLVVEGWRAAEGEGEGGGGRIVFRTMVERGAAAAAGRGAGARAGAEASALSAAAAGGATGERAAAISQAAVSFFSAEEMRWFELEDAAEEGEQEAPSAGASWSRL